LPRDGQVTHGWRGLLSYPSFYPPVCTARVPFDVHVARVDEDAVRQALQAEETPPRDVADALAELKASRISDKHPGAFVLGSDQVLAFQGQILSKPKDQDEAVAQLSALRGQRHSLYSAAVICENGQPIWRHIGVVHLSMRMATDSYIQDYVGQKLGKYPLFCRWL